MNLLLGLANFAFFAILFAGTEAIPTAQVANGLQKRSLFQPTNPLTNAQRLAQGFVLKTPKRHTPGRIYARVSPTPTDSDTPTSTPVSVTPSDSIASSSIASLSTPTPSPPSSSSIPTPPTSSSVSPSSSSASSSSASPTPSTVICPARTTFIRGYIKATAQDNSITGYIRAAPNGFGEFGLTADVNSALIFHSCKPYTGLLELTIENVPSVSQPYLGFFKGFASTDASIGYSSANYMYLGGVEHVPVSSPEVHDTSFRQDLPSESSVWTLDVSNRFATQWINPDFTSPVPTVAYVPSSDGFILTGNLPKFTSTYGPATRVTLSYVAILN